VGNGTSGMSDVHDSAPVADWASSGAIPITGSPQAPLLPPGFGATAARGGLLALDALIGPTGIRGDQLIGERAALSQWPANAPWSLGSRCRAVRALDGHLALSLARESDLELIPALVSDAHALGWGAVDEWAAGRPVKEVVARCRLLGLPAGEVGGVRARELMRIRSSGPTKGRTLAGLRIVDLSSLWAGPLCASLLGLSGAEVIRLESRQRPDGGREGLPAFDDLLHASQASVSFDPDAPELLHRLVDSADIVITSARPRGLASLGLDPQHYLAERTHGVWVQISAYGSTGPEADWVGFGDDVAMAAGLVRWVDGTPIPVADALADPLAGIHAAVGAAALAGRGGTHLLELALADVASATTLQQPLTDPTLVEDRWHIETEFGPREVAQPRARIALAHARALGADNERFSKPASA